MPLAIDGRRWRPNGVMDYFYGPGEINSPFSGGLIKEFTSFYLNKLVIDF